MEGKLVEYVAIIMCIHVQSVKDMLIIMRTDTGFRERVSNL